MKSVLLLLSSSSLARDTPVKLIIDRWCTVDMYYDSAKKNMIFDVVLPQYHYLAFTIGGNVHTDGVDMVVFRNKGNKLNTEITDLVGNGLTKEPLTDPDQGEWTFHVKAADAQNPSRVTF